MAGAVQTHEFRGVAVAGRAVDFFGQFEHAVAFSGSGTHRGAAGGEALQHPAHLEVAEMMRDVDIGDEDAATREDPDETLAGQALERFADGSAAEPEELAKRGLGDDGSGQQSLRDDQVLEPFVGDRGEWSIDFVASARHCTRLLNEKIIHWNLRPAFAAQPAFAPSQNILLSVLTIVEIGGAERNKKNGR